MGALPKRKTSKARRDKRRSHLALTPPNTTECPQCHSQMMPHRVCPTCGHYAGREIIEIEGPKPKANG